jgi:hypothetical protein
MVSMYRPPQYKEIVCNSITAKDLSLQTRKFINQPDIQNVIQIETEVRFHHFNYHISFTFPNTVMWPNSESVQYSSHYCQLRSTCYWILSVREMRLQFVSGCERVCVSSMFVLIDNGRGYFETG